MTEMRSLKGNLYLFDLVSVSRLSLLEMHSVSDRQPDVVLSRQAPLVQVWPNTIYYWGGLCVVVPTGSGPCSAGTLTLSVPNALVHNELNYWAGRYICTPCMPCKANLGIHIGWRLPYLGGGLAWQMKR